MKFLLFFWPLILAAVSYQPLRAPIDPFLSGDTFRAYCDHAYDEITELSHPEGVEKGSTIFVNGDLLEGFFRDIHPFIRVPYILISHNTDCSIPGAYRAYLDDEKILAWFTQNQDETVHVKLHALPIGLENRQWNRMNWETLTRIKAKELPKKILLYGNFNAQTFPEERNGVRDLFFPLPYCYSSARKTYELFSTDLSLSKFVLSPRGNGLDTHRLWEALYVGSIPIVKTSSLDALYEGLPILIISDWSEVTEDFLNRKYEEMRGRSYSLEKLYVDYWLKRIEACKKD